MNFSLGPVSEQASESVHHDFSEKWKNYKVANTHPNFGGNLLKAIVAYNSQNL